MSVAEHTVTEREEAETHEQRALGFWLYLMGDAVIFALLFATYAIMIPGTAGGPTGRDLFDLNNAALETALLLVSSMTFGFASLASRTGNRGAVLVWLAITFLLGASFVFLEVREFAGLIAGKAGRLHIAIECHACFDWLFPVLEMFRHAWPEIDVDIRAGLAFEALPALNRAAAVAA